MSLPAKRIAIIGGGPSGLFMFKRLIEKNDPTVQISIFEKGNVLGAGMPYSNCGAADEHITNVSGNEIPDLKSSVEEWVQAAPSSLKERYGIFPETYNDYKVFPRLFFGNYLSYQFDALIKKAKEKKIDVALFLNTAVTDISDRPQEKNILLTTADRAEYIFDRVIICTGHHWPKVNEGRVPQYFDSPYPPAKLGLKVNYPVALRGSSLTAIDAVRTLARHNGVFTQKEDGMLRYKLNEDSEGFHLMLYSRHGMLPAIRFHLEDTHLGKETILSEDIIKKNREENDGFLSLDFVFEENFIKPIRQQDPVFYEHIRKMSMEEFVDEMMALRERLDAFTLFKAEYAEAERSIKRKESVYWKEMLAVLSFAMNYPAKHFSAEDMLRLKKILMPLISIVIAFVPQASAKELIALQEAGVLDITAVGEDSYVSAAEPHGAIVHFTDEENVQHSKKYKLFVDCIGQPHLSYEDFPFKSLLKEKVISRAVLKFRSNIEGALMYQQQPEAVEISENGDHYLRVPGITINDHFQVLDRYGGLNDRIYIMAVPFIAGFNPDYSGLDFCEAASARIVRQIFPEEINKTEPITA